MIGSIRRILTALVIVLTVAIQSAVIARWNLPGATPDLVLVVIAAFGMKQHAARAAVLGFSAGLLLDATPPSVGLLGVSALSLSIVAYLAAQLRTDISRSPFGPLVFVAVASAANVMIHAALSGLLGDATWSLSQLPAALLASTCYAALLATFVVPLVRALVTVLMPAPTVFLRR